VHRPLAILALCALSTAAQYVRDTALFALPLVKDNPSSVRLCQYNRSAQEMPAGPVVMAGGSLLLFCGRGYLLCDSSGAVLDSHQVSAQDAGLRLAFPFDSVSLLYYRTGGAPPRPVRIFRKRLTDPGMTELSDEEYRWLGAAHAGVFVNIARNAVVDARTVRLNLAPQLVGYTALAGGERWWALGREATLGSPVIYGDAAGRGALFAGLFEGEGTRLPRDAPSPELRATFVRDGRRCYVGVQAQTNVDLPRCVQRIVVCDDAGNVLWADTVLKQENADMMVGLQAQGGENVIALVRGTTVLAFPPAVDGAGRVYYGVADFNACTFAVRRRDCLVFLPMSGEPIPPQPLAVERDIAWEAPSFCPCPMQRTGAEIPSVTFTGPDGQRRSAAVRDLTRAGFIARIARQARRDVEAKVSRGVPGLPRDAVLLRDSLAALAGTGCPWVLSLSGPDGYIRTFAFGPDEPLLCARVLGLLPDSTVVVRADLPRAAEILLFTPRGSFVNRFAFNRQPHKERKDLLLVRPDGVLVEQDFERNPAGMFLRWEAVLY